MSFDPERFLELSRELMKDAEYQNSEVTHRTAVGRAYYAAFLTVRERFQAVGRGIGKRKTHARVIKALKSVDESLGDQLFKLRRCREDCDYEMEARIGSSTASYCIGLSEFIIRQARSTIR